MLGKYRFKVDCDELFGYLVIGNLCPLMDNDRKERQWLEELN